MSSVFNSNTFTGGAYVFLYENQEQNIEQLIQQALTPYITTNQAIAIFLTKSAFDNSYNSIINLIQEIDGSLNIVINDLTTEKLRNNIQDISINNIEIEITDLDISLNNEIIRNNTQDISINNLNISLNNEIIRNNTQDISINNLDLQISNLNVNIDASLNTKVNKSGDIISGSLYFQPQFFVPHIATNSGAPFNIGAGGLVRMIINHGGSSFLGVNNFPLNTQHAMEVEAGGNVLMNNNVGIGNTPATKLDVRGNIICNDRLRIRRNLLTDGNINSDREFIIFNNNDRTNFFRQGQGAGGDILTLRDGGNVGIGNTSPNYKLDVNGDTRITGYIKQNLGDKLLDIGDASNHYREYKLLFTETDLTTNERVNQVFKINQPVVANARGFSYIIELDYIAVLSRVVSWEPNEPDIYEGKVKVYCSSNTQIKNGHRFIVNEVFRNRRGNLTAWSGNNRYVNFVGAVNPNDANEFVLNVVYRNNFPNGQRTKLFYKHHLTYLEPNNLGYVINIDFSPNPAITNFINVNDTLNTQVGISRRGREFAPLSVSYDGEDNINYGIQIHNNFRDGNSNRDNLILFTDENSTQGALGGFRSSASNHFFGGLKFFTGGQPSGYIQDQPFTPLDATNSLVERLRITPAGNVGINNSNPLYHLDVNGQVFFSDTLIGHNAGSFCRRISYSYNTNSPFYQSVYNFSALPTGNYKICLTSQITSITNNADKIFKLSTFNGSTTTIIANRFFTEGANAFVNSFVVNATNVVLKNTATFDVRVSIETVNSSGFNSSGAHFLSFDRIQTI